MESINALDAKNSFGEMIRKAQRSPVRITNRGKPVAVVMSIEDYEMTEELKLNFLKESIAESLRDIEAGRVMDVDKFFEELASK